MKQSLVGDVMQEIVGTRRILESTWKPHERSMSLGELATHIVNLFFWKEAILRYPEFDLAVAPRTFGISHMIHHRAQLGVYLRIFDISVPGLYGPSANDKLQVR